MGKIELHKIKKKFTELLPVPDSNQSPDFYFKCAAQKNQYIFFEKMDNFPIDQHLSLKKRKDLL